MAETAESRHRQLERKMGLFAILTTIAILIGGAVELIPLFTRTPGSDEARGVEPYSALELAGRDIYVREGCYNCHSQMVRPFRSETIRYGTWSRSYEYLYDRPFQLGSRRIGPDLHREAGRYHDSWHYVHLVNPRDTSPGSVMPSYDWLVRNKVDVEVIQANMTALQTLGTPYTDAEIEAAGTDMEDQGTLIVDALAAANIEADWNDEIVAVIAYLQSLGRFRPMFPELEGSELGEALFVEMRCQRCHGPEGEGGVPNPNYANGNTPALSTLAVNRLLIGSAEQAEHAIALLAEGVDLQAMVDAEDLPWVGFDRFVGQLETIRATIRNGSPAGQADPEGPQPISMPSWRNQLNNHRIDAVIGYLISIYPWESGS